MALTRPDSRQIINRAALSKVGAAAGTTQDSLNSKFNLLADAPLRPAASFPTPDAKLNFSNSLISTSDGANEVAAPVSGAVYDAISTPFINFQTQAVSNLSDFDITWPSPNVVGRYRRAAFTLESGGKIQVIFSAEAVTEGALVNAGTLFGTGLPLGYVNLQCTNTIGYFKTAGSSTDIIENAKVFRFGTGGSASNSGGVAQEVALTVGTTSKVVTFPTPQLGTGYAVLAQVYNSTDANPEYFSVIITNKTASGFTVSWNFPLDSGNYLLDYLVAPGVIMEQIGETLLPSGVTSAVITIPIPLSTTSYVVVAEMVNMVDSVPQFQPVIVVAKTLSSFSVQWNVPTDSANYRLAFQVAAYQ